MLISPAILPTPKIWSREGEPSSLLERLSFAPWPHPARVPTAGQRTAHTRRGASTHRQQTRGGAHPRRSQRSVIRQLGVNIPRAGLFTPSWRGG